MKKKIVLVLSVLLCLSLVINVLSRAEEAECWYIKRGKNGSAPSFPESSRVVDEYGGIYINKDAYGEGKKILYLTFDAGYENGNISKILDTMKEKGVTATFFILGHLINDNPELVRRMADEGHTVANHTRNHKDMTTLNEQEFLANLSSLEEMCLSKTGVCMSKFFRFPEGRYSKEKLKASSENGYTTVFWSIAYADWDNKNQPDENSAISRLLSQTHPGAVILLHPTSKTNANILGTLIDRWRDMGYEFGALEDIK